jgi:Domain of unknown function (DUF4124)
MNTDSRYQQIERTKNDAPASPSRNDWKRSVLLAAVLLLLALVYTASRDAHAVTYKWVDDKGIVHYSDKIPADAVNRGHVELDKQGVHVKKTDAALTPEQLRVRAADAERQRQEAKEREVLARRDRALLASYTREEDLDVARQRALTTIDGQMQSARVYAAALVKRQQEILEKKQTAGNKGAPAALERELESVEAELAKTNALIETKKQESLSVATKYDIDKQRWRMLRANADLPGTIATSQAGGSAVNVLPTSAAR